MMKKYIVTCIVIGVMALLLVLPVAAATTDNDVFETPEAVIEHFYEGFAENDLEKMMATGYGDFADQYDFAAAVRQMNGMTSFAPLGAPNEHPLYQGLTTIALEARFATEIKTLAQSLLLEPPYLDLITNTGVMLKLDDDFDYESFVEAADPARLSSLAIGRIEPAEDVADDSISYDELTESFRVVYGGDEYAERVIVLEFEEKEYVAGATLIRVGDEWRILRLTSLIAGTPTSGAAMLLSDYEPPAQGGP